ncbi:malto-oligosyltrehalose trehalohydrolase [Phytohalomonas tamaricis]|uniref:malto-oligosyltrehalose trehalohydrolase n=1 Tax=Phytohalomonas tamaricis TaxID=2081032 RepID=UPI000D0ACFE3|nr:malto-oligosyltrehalose trehalohydrolase [Phytohalomonas tamaricis]
MTRRALYNASSSGALAWHFEFETTFGANIIDEETVHFSIWAPDAELVSVEIEGQGTVPMDALDNGHFTLDTPCLAGARYRYLINDETPVPDPAARMQAEDVDGYSVVVDPYNYEWMCPDWRGRPWNETVIYELHVGAMGGFVGVMERLPELAALGVTAIELMPLNDFPGQRNWGYDGVLPYAVASAYGSPEELKELIDAAHEHQMMVFLDVVYNHFGPDGNYLFQYAKGFFREDINTPWGPAIDFRRPEVRTFFIDNALMWLKEYRFDGLRFDAVHAITEQDFLIEMSAVINQTISAGRQVHLMLENEHNSATLLESAYDAQWNDDGHNVLHVLLTGENEAYYSDYFEDATNKLVRCLSEGFIFQGQNTRHGHSRGEPSGHLPPSAFILFLQNHDQIGNRAMGDRLTQLADVNALRAATVLLLLSPMIPMIFMGDEWGSKQPFLFFTDHKPELADAVREGRRAEFADFAAFNDEEARKAIPDPNAESTFSASMPDFTLAESEEHGEWRAFYRTLLALRHEEIVPRLEGASFGEAKALGDGAVIACWTMGDDSVLTIAVNIGSQPVSLPEPNGRRLFDSDESTPLANQELPPARAVAWLNDTASEGAV